jgi:hypothetical protein
MRLKMENPNKVNNIVIGSFDGLTQLYGPASSRFKAMERAGIIEQIEGDKIKVGARLLANTYFR